MLSAASAMGRESENTSFILSLNSLKTEDQIGNKILTLRVGKISGTQMIL
jgi:hypothetical protein